jgi:hypothetical protein
VILSLTLNPAVEEGVPHDVYERLISALEIRELA